MNKLYVYEGAVFENGPGGYLIEKNWKAYTWAKSVKKARSNLACQFKRSHGKAVTASIYMAGSVKLVDETKYDDGEQLSFL